MLTFSYFLELLIFLHIFGDSSGGIITEWLALHSKQSCANTPLQVAPRTFLNAPVRHQVRTASLPRATFKPLRQRVKRIRPSNDFERHAYDLNNLERTLGIAPTRPIGESIYVYRQNEANRVERNCIKLIEFHDNGRAVSAQLRATARNIRLSWKLIRRERERLYTQMHMQHASLLYVHRDTNTSDGSMRFQRHANAYIPR